MLFGIGMGGEWGVGASLALESASPRIRGLLSGLLQEGYAHRQPARGAGVPHGLSLGARRTIGATRWRVMFFLGGLPALLSLFIRMRVKESEAWHEHRTDWADLPRSLLSELAALLLPGAADDDDELHVARHAGHVSDAAAAPSATPRRASPTSRCCRWSARCSAGWSSATTPIASGRRRAMIIAASCALLVLPIWIAGFSPLIDARRRLPDAVLRAGRVGRHPGAHQRAVAGRPARLLSRASPISSASCAQRASPTSSPRWARSSRTRRRWACS